MSSKKKFPVLEYIQKQNSNTKYLLFNINDLIEDLSTVFTLEPGDIIATGTPAGVGPVVIGDGLVGRIEGKAMFKIRVK